MGFHRTIDSGVLVALCVWAAIAVGCEKYTVRYCDQASDCEGGEWNNETCGLEAGLWDCQEGICEAVCQAVPCGSVSDCLGESWPSHAECSAPDGRWACGQEPSASVLDLLPEDYEVGEYVRLGAPTSVADEEGLYAMMAGGAPAYLDRGWRDAVFVDYGMGTTVASVGIHNMGDQANAIDVFTYLQPLGGESLWDQPDSAALLDGSRPTSYGLSLWVGRFYADVRIDRKSQASETIITLFGTTIRARSSLPICLAVCNP